MQHFHTHLAVDLLLECGPEELEEEELLALVGSKVVEREDDALHELCSLRLRHREHKLRQVRGGGLQWQGEAWFVLQRDTSRWVRMIGEFV